MASVYDLKPKFQNFLRPLVFLLHKSNITPNQITVFALLGSCVVGFIGFFTNCNPIWLILLPSWLFIRMAMNAIDGMLAREYNLKSVEGAMLNELGDVLSDIMLYLPFCSVGKGVFWPVICFVMGSILTEFCGLLGQALGGKRRYEGPMGKSDRAFAVGSISLISFFLPNVIIYWQWLFVIAFLLTLLTCANRLAFAVKELKNE
ncbi:MAG: CDP-alcohol phosphatidyltransferase family protein [Candidatus Omnitrophica bacterium]|nr:CDP-alcohol phosphatidyltransferase family protein [Candidatus Omnitrophota bacterium]